MKPRKYISILSFFLAYNSLLFGSTPKPVTSNEQLLARVIDTGKVIIPKPKVLDDLPDELVISGGFIDAETNSPLVDIGFTLIAGGDEIISSRTTEEGKFEIKIPIRKIQIKSARALLAGKFSFAFNMWGRTISVYEYKDKLPKPVIEFFDNFKGNLWQEKKSLFAQALHFGVKSDVVLNLLTQNIQSEGERHTRWLINLGTPKVTFGGHTIRLVLSAFDEKSKKRMDGFIGCLSEPTSFSRCTKSKKTGQLKNEIVAIEVRKWKLEKNLKVKATKVGYETGYFGSEIEKLVPTWWENKKGERDDIKGELPVFWIDIPLEKSDYISGMLYLQAVTNSQAPISAKNQVLRIAGNANAGEIRCEGTSTSVRGQPEFSCKYRVVHQPSGNSLALTLENAGKKYKGSINIRLSKGERVITSNSTEGNFSFIDYHTMEPNVPNKYLCRNKKNICLRVKLKDVLGEYEFSAEQVADKLAECRSKNISPCAIKEAPFKGGTIKGHTSFSTKDGEEIKFLVDDYTTKAQFWKGVPDFSGKLHYPCNDEQKAAGKKDPNCEKGEGRRVDLSGKKYNPEWPNWYGPNSPFRVKGFIFGDKWHGTNLTLEVLSSDHKNVLCKVDLVHIDNFNSALFVEMGSKIHSAGTFLGITKNKIAVSDSPHLHMEIIGNSKKRKDLVKCFGGG